MDISPYLAALIKEKNEVIVPGLGTFSKEQIPAQFDASRGTFLPPLEHIAFKTDFSEDQTLLNYIIKAENSDKKTVVNFLKQYVDNLNDLLASTELIKIDLLGTFEKTTHGFTFEADETLASNSTYYGLKPQPEIIEMAAYPAPTVIEESRTEGIEEIEEEIEEEFSPSNWSVKKTVLVVFIILLSAFAGLQFFYPEVLNSLGQRGATTPPPPAPILKKDIIIQTDTTTLADTTQQNIKADSLITEPPVTPKISTYEIVVAAFGKRSEADNFIKQLQSRGIQAHALANRSKEYIKISVGTFNDKETAETELKRIQAELSKGAWIYHFKPKKTK